MRIICRLYNFLLIGIHSVVLYLLRAVEDTKTEELKMVIQYDDRILVSCFIFGLSDTNVRCSVPGLHFFNSLQF